MNIKRKLYCLFISIPFLGGCISDDKARISQIWHDYEGIPKYVLENPNKEQKLEQFSVLRGIIFNKSFSVNDANWIDFQDAYDYMKLCHGHKYADSYFASLGLDKKNFISDGDLASIIVKDGK